MSFLLNRIQRIIFPLANQTKNVLLPLSSLKQLDQQNNSTIRSIKTQTHKRQPLIRSALPQFVNLPPTSGFGGQGNPFETKIKRKRVVPDPNIPNLEYLEELKWATWRQLRDARRRMMLERYFPQRTIYKNIKCSKLLPQSIREVGSDCLHNLPRDSTFLYQRNRCAITGRSRGIVKRYRLSRLVFRHLADYNKLSGVIKACWS